MKRFGGHTGPETVVYVNTKPVAGAWTPTRAGAAVEDESRKYTVAIPEDRLDELRGLLRQAGNSFDQKVIYLDVAGYAEFLEIRSDDGFLGA